MARRSLILDAGAVIALSRGDRRARSVLAAAHADQADVMVPPVVVTQTVRGTQRDAPVNQLLRTVWVPFVGKQLAQAAGTLLGASGTVDAADAQVVAEAIRSAPSLILTSDLKDMRRLVEGYSNVDILLV